MHRFTDAGFSSMFIEAPTDFTNFTHFILLKSDINRRILSHACKLVNRKARGLGATSHA